MTKEYTWNEIRDFLKDELIKTKHIMTWGTIGSCNIEKDIDTIITKKPKSKSSDFYKEVHKIFDNLDSYLNKKYMAKVIKFSRSADEIILEHFGRKNKNYMAFHVMTYSSYSQLEKDWSWGLFLDENIKDILIKNYSCIIGDVNDLFGKDFISENYYDSIFTYLDHGDMIHLNFPEEVLINVMNSYFDYLYRKRLKLKSPIAKNEKEVRKYFYELCDIVDELEKSRN